MGLTKQYLRYRCSGICNIVGSGRGGAAFLSKDTAAVASVGDVTVWDLRKKERLGSLVVDTKKKVEVTVISPSPSDTRMLAVGYSDGSIRCALKSCSLFPKLCNIIIADYGMLEPESRIRPSQDTRPASRV